MDYSFLYYFFFAAALFFVLIVYTSINLNKKYFGASEAEKPIKKRIEPIHMKEYSLDFEITCKNLIGLELKKITLFQINDYYPENENLFIIDGGIELELSNVFFTFGFSTDLECYLPNISQFQAIYINENEYVLNLSNKNPLRKLFGKKIKDIAVITKDFNEIADYSMKTQKTKRIVEVVFYFEENFILQIAAIKYKDPNNKKYYYDLSEEMLISPGSLIQIDNSNL